MDEEAKKLIELLKNEAVREEIFAIVVDGIKRTTGFNGIVKDVYIDREKKEVIMRLTFDEVKMINLWSEICEKYCGDLGMCPSKLVSDFTGYNICQNLNRKLKYAVKVINGQAKSSNEVMFR